MENTKPRTRLTGIAAAIVCACLAFTLVACGTTGSASSAASSASASVSSVESAQASNGSASASSATSSASASAKTPSKDGITVNETITSSADGEHAIQADGTTESYSNIAVQKTGDSNSGDEADFYGDNAAIFATNGATLSLSDIIVETDGTHANGVFSYGEGTTVNVSDSVIETSGNCSGGLMTTGGGTMNATNLLITTSGNSSAAIRSDRGGGTVTVTGGEYTTSGTGSPVIYSTADITVNGASLESTASQGVVVEGKNSVTLNDTTLVADNNTKNSDKSSYYQAVMIYQSMSGDAATGEASFAMNGGSLENANGDVFFVNNTVATISLDSATIVNNDSTGVFLRAAAAGWGSEGTNGGQVTLNATNQAIDGDIVVDDVSNLNLYLKDSSAFTGAVNSDGEAGDVYVELSGGSKWVLTGDSYITSLTCDVDSIDLNGHTLYVDGKAYTAGTASTGEAIQVVVSESSGHGAPPDGSGGAPSGSAPSGAPGSSSGGTPPAKPSGEAPSSSSSSK